MLTQLCVRAAIAAALAVSSIAASAASPTTNTAFNPAVGLILDGRYQKFSKDPETYSLPGFALGGEAGLGDEGLRLGESELGLSANVDDQFYGAATFALTPENEAEVEEAYFETLSLGAGATIKGGRFLSHVGYLNNIHGHAWDFADEPLVYRALFGGQYKDDGVQLRWVAPTDVLLEVGTELFRGEEFPAGGAAHDGQGVNTVFVRVGGDVGVSHAWRVGVSHLVADALERESGDEAAPDVFTGKSRSTGLDFIWKWAPNGNIRERNARFQFEYWQRDEHGTFDPISSGTPLDYRGKQRGWYAQTVVQFMPRWRAGVRYDKLEADDVDAVLAGTVLDNQGHNPTRTSAMVDFSNSEFSRLRLQVNRDASRADEKDTQWMLQYTMSLGAHSAHAF